MSEMNIFEYLKKRKADDLIIDLRESVQYAFGTIEGAVNIPLSDIKRLYQLPRDRKIFLFCQAGEFSAEMTELLSEEGYEVCNLTGGYREYLREQAEQMK